MTDYKFPKAMGTCADMLYKIKAERLTLQKKVDEIAEKETALKSHIINNLPKSQASGVAGMVARVTVVTKDVPKIEDDTKFYAYLAKTKNWGLMQKRLSDASIKELWENGKEIPGIGRHSVVTLSLNKV